jgi:hypothetical protein
VNGRAVIREEGSMTLALKRIKVYLKLTAILAVIAVILTIVLMNVDNTADIWFFRPYKTVNVVWLILITAVSAIASWWIVLKVFGTLRELRGLRRAREDRQRIDEQQRLARELAEREKRIDEKLRRSITEE